MARDDADDILIPPGADIDSILGTLDAWGDRWTIHVDRLLDELAAGIGDGDEPQEEPMGKMSVSQYARSRRERGLRGGTRQAVQDALTRGWFGKTSDGMIDADLADRAWAQNTDPRKHGGKGAPGGGAAGDGDTATPRDSGAQQPVPGSLNQARLVNEVLRAKRQRLQLEQEEGRLVDADAVARRWFEAGQRIRDLLFAMKDQLAPEVVALVRGEPDDGRAAVAVAQLLDQHMRRALQSLGTQPGTQPGGGRTG